MPKGYRNGSSVRDQLLISIVSLYHHSYMKYCQVQDLSLTPPCSQRSSREIPLTDATCTIYSDICIFFLIHVTGLEL